jgi:biopolymer transport protein ExbD
MSIFPPARPRQRGDYILPMINIVFLLLLFFLTAGSLANRNEAESGVPITATLPLERLPRPLLLVQADGSVELDGRPVARDDVVGEFQTAAAGTLPVSVLADPAMPAAVLLALVDTLRGAGMEVRLVTLRREGPGAVTP